MKTCFKCSRTDSEVRLFDGININEAVKTCERCALLEGIPILKNPSVEQLKKSEKSDYVYRRLRKIAGFRDDEPKKSVFEQLQELDMHPELEKPEETPLNLIDNFHWAVQRERRRRGLSQKQLAQSIGESEVAIRMIEAANLPENVLPVINKLEQYLRIALVKQGRGFMVKPAKLLKEESQAKTAPAKSEESLKIEELLAPEMKISAGMQRAEESQKIREAAGRKEPAQVLRFRKDRLEGITIADLREMQRVVESDFPKKTSEQIGREQLDDFGKTEKTQAPDSMRSWSEEYFKKRKEKKREEDASDKFLKSGAEEKVPTIAELAARKKEQDIESDAKSVLGSEIEIVEEEEGKEKPDKGKPQEDTSKEREAKQILGDDIEFIEAGDAE